jgi:ferrous iron transport protein A
MMSLETPLQTCCSDTELPRAGPTVPLSFLRNGDIGTVQKVSGKTEVRKFLEGLGFVPGTPVRIVSYDRTGHILEIKGSRIAIDNGMATKIMVSQ